MFTINQVVAEIRRAAKSVYLSFQYYGAKAKAAIKFAVTASLRAIDDLRHWAIVRVIRFIRFWFSLRDAIAIVTGLVAIPWIIYYTLTWLAFSKLVSTIAAVVAALCLTFVIVSGIRRLGDIPREDAHAINIGAWDFVADIPGVKFAFYATLTVTLTYALYASREILIGTPPIKDDARQLTSIQPAPPIDKKATVNTDLSKAFEKGDLSAPTTPIQTQEQSAKALRDATIELIRLVEVSESRGGSCMWTPAEREGANGAFNLTLISSKAVCTGTSGRLFERICAEASAAMARYNANVSACPS